MTERTTERTTWSKSAIIAFATAGIRVSGSTLPSVCLVEPNRGGLCFMKNNGNQTSLRLWPGFVIVVVQFMAAFGVSKIAPATPAQFFSMTGGPALGLLAIFLWWFFGSRASRSERIFGIVFPVLLFVVVFALADPSVPMAIYVSGIPFFACLSLFGLG